jgi:hypothetical protein
MTHNIKIRWEFKSGFFRINFFKNELLPIDDINRILINILAVKSLSFTFAVSSSIHCVKIIPKFRVNLSMMRIVYRIVGQPMNKEDRPSKLWMVFVECTWPSIILYFERWTIISATANWHIKFYWINFWPFVLRRIHYSTVSFLSFSKPFCCLIEDIIRPSIVFPFD